MCRKYTLIHNMTIHLQYPGQDAHLQRVNAGRHREWGRKQTMNHERLDRVIELVAENDSLCERLYDAQLNEYTAIRAHHATSATLMRREAHHRYAN